MKRKAGRDLLQTETTYTAEVINNVEYLNTKYTDQFVNIVKSHKSIQPNINATITAAATVA